MYWEGFTLARYVLSTKIGLHRIDFIDKTLVNDDFSKQISNFLFTYVKYHKF